MDPDSKRIQQQLNDLEIQIFKQRNYGLSDASTVLQPFWLRCLVQNSTRFDRFLLDYGFNFLWRCGIFSWILFFIKAALT